MTVKLDRADFGRQSPLFLRSHKPSVFTRFSCASSGLCVVSSLKLRKAWQGRGEASIKPAEAQPAPEVEEGGDDEEAARARKKQKVGPQKPADKDRGKPQPELKTREAEVRLPENPR